MEHTDFRRAIEILDAAGERTGAEFDAFLADACRGRADLLRAVQRILASDPDLRSGGGRTAERIVERGRQALATDLWSPPERVGNYRIAGVIGEGGMGVVYRAEQDHPRRAVALKMLRPGRDEARTRRRFELEAEVLGRLTHPGIARIYEAGVVGTEHGARPFFAMELVDGLPLHVAAHELNLSSRERIELVARVCDAVQHAHDRGVIHRDLKPGNILVTAGGDPRVLDFGVARATDSDLELTTQHTDVGQVLGTLPYMSPEQAQGDSARVDARSDVYALGVVAYELLTGRLPYEVRGKSLPAALRVIVDQDPTPLSSSDRALRGDLETIVGKALEKDKARRYGSAAELADDVRRFLADQPIKARPATTTYQLRKFARRNPWLVGGVAAVIVALALGVVATSWQAVRVARASDRAMTQQRIASEVTRFLSELFVAAAPAHTLGRIPDARELLDRGARKLEANPDMEPAVRAQLASTIGHAYLSLDQFEPAARWIEHAHDLMVELHGAGAPELLSIYGHLAGVRRELSDLDGAIPIYREALRIAQALDGGDSARTATWRAQLGRALAETGEHAQAREQLELAWMLHDPTDLGLRMVVLNHFANVCYLANDLEHAELHARRNLELCRANLDPLDPAVASAVGTLLTILQHTRAYAEAEELAIEALAIRASVMNDTETFARSLHNLGMLWIDSGRHDAAELAMRAGLAIRLRQLPVGHPNLTTQCHGLGVALRLRGEAIESLGCLLIAEGQRSEDPLRRTRLLQDIALVLRASNKPDVALPWFAAAIEQARGHLAPSDPLLGEILAGAAVAMLSLGQAADAESCLRESIDQRTAALGAADPKVASSESLLARALVLLGRHDEAAPLAVSSYERLAKAYGEAHGRVREARGVVVDALERSGDAEGVARYRALEPSDR